MLPPRPCSRFAALLGNTPFAPCARTWLPFLPPKRRGTHHLTPSLSVPSPPGARVRVLQPLRAVHARQPLHAVLLQHPGVRSSVLRCAVLRRAMPCCGVLCWGGSPLTSSPRCTEYPARALNAGGRALQRTKSPLPPPVGRCPSFSWSSPAARPAAGHGGAGDAAGARPAQPGPAAQGD